MTYITKFYERDFTSKDPKNAYMLACEFVAKHVVSKSSKVEVEKVSWKICRNQKANNLPTFRLTLFYNFNDSEVKSQMCSACQEFHNSAFCNEPIFCSSCSKVVYEDRIAKRLLSCATYYKELMSDELAKF